jgi:hypothetical protein
MIQCIEQVCSDQIWAICLAMVYWDFISRRGTATSNHSRWLRDEWWTVTHRPSAAAQRNARPHHCLYSPELAVYDASNIGFWWGFHLRHRGDVANLFCSPWDDSGQWWWLVLAGRFGPSSASMSVGSRAPPAKLKAPVWASVFGEAPEVVDLAPEGR